MTARKPRPDKIAADIMDIRLHAHYPVGMEVFDVECIKALARGDASEHQQKHALDYMINIVCGTYDMSFRAGYEGAQKEQDFAEGRRFCGNTLVKALRINPEALKPRGETNG